MYYFIFTLLNAGTFILAAILYEAYPELDPF